jgi:hypothetical protein
MNLTCRLNLCMAGMENYYAVDVGWYRESYKRDRFGRAAVRMVGQAIGTSSEDGLVAFSSGLNGDNLAGAAEHRDLRWKGVRPSVQGHSKCDRCRHLRRDGVQWHSITNKDGDWRVQALPVGHYRFEVTAPGFKTLDHAPVELQVSDQKFVDAVLNIGTATETVTVQGTPLIDTTAAISGTVISTGQLEELPTVTNSPVDFVKLTPGGLFGQASGGAAHLYSNNSESAVTVNASGSVNYQIEGGTNTFGTNDQIAFIPPTDSVAEMRITTTAYDASIGRTETATLDMTFKSGTKNYHGTLYENNQNNTFNARVYNTNALAPIPSVHFNEFGGTLGGPVSIPKLFDGTGSTRSSSSVMTVSATSSRATQWDASAYRPCSKDREISASPSR